MQEAGRGYVHAFLAPVGEIVAAELADRLGTPGLRLDFSALFASITGRARAFASMVQAGMDAERAVALSGLLAEGAGEYTLRRGRLIARLFPTPSGCYLEWQRRNRVTDSINCPAQWWESLWGKRAGSPNQQVWFA